MGADTIAGRVRWLRETNGLTLEQFGKRCGFQKSYVSKLERGVAKNPSIDLISKIAGAFGVTTGWLATGQGLPNRDAGSRIGSDRINWPSIACLTSEELTNCIHHFQQTKKSLPAYLQKIYEDLLDRLISEQLERWKKKAG